MRIKGVIFKRKIVLLTTILFCIPIILGAADKFIFPIKDNSSIVLYETGVIPSIWIESTADKGVERAVLDLQSDFTKVTGAFPQIISGLQEGKSPLIIIGTIGANSIIDELVKQKKLNGSELKNKNEKFIIQSITNPFQGVNEAIVIAGSDKRGTIYGIYELSRQLGVSPWYYWADVPVAKMEAIYFQKGIYTDGEPAVTYRGIFLNDEWPSLGGWAQSTFGGFNSKFYEKVFELILRLKGNFLWPAMWNSAFYDDDPLNGPLADEMGIVMSTSHHEPMSLAQKDWSRRRNGDWNYNTNAKNLQDFWRMGIERSKDWEQIVTIGMRGDGDEAMEEDTNITLLEKIVQDQREIIQKVTGKKAKETPQVWALYKEVQDYYDSGMRVPDDVTLLYCDDNWGNVRKLPNIDAKPRKGGYGMYYHFDYVGAPRNSKWLNISPVQRIWEQMNLSYEHGVDRIWVVNVGDLKPMEYPISFFLDMAWNPRQFNAQNLIEHTKKWVTEQFGETHASEIARMINFYSKYNRRVTPEMLNENTYSLENYNEFERVVNEYRELALDAQRLYNDIPAAQRDAYFQLVLYPIDACSNLYEMYYAVAKNKQLAKKNDIRANYFADKAKKHFERDSLLSYEYNNNIADGKWKHMMDQTHIGYTSWQEPKRNVIPEVKYVSHGENAKKTFIEKDGYVSIEAEDYLHAVNSTHTRWEVIPYFGKTKSGVTIFPQNVYPAEDEELYLEYGIEFESTGEFEVQLYLAPTLNYNENKGLRYAISFDGEIPQIINFNGHYKGELDRWQAEHIIKSTSKHTISQSGTHTLRFSVLDPGIVLQKIVVDTGGLKPTYLGPPASDYK